MKINIDKTESFIDVNKVVIQTNEDVEFTISIDKFGNLVVNKQQYGDGDGNINIIPRVSNEISLK